MIHPTHFNATKLLKDLKLRPKGVKISQFLDNHEIQQRLLTVLHHVETKEGCMGYTALPNELYTQYLKWLQQVGSGKGRHKQVDSSLTPKV